MSLKFFGHGYFVNSVFCLFLLKSNETWHAYLFILLEAFHNNTAFTGKKQGLV